MTNPDGSTPDPRDPADPTHRDRGRSDDAAQPGQGYPAQPGEAHPGQPEHGFPGQAYPGQPGQAHPGQQDQGYPAQPGEAYPAQLDQGYPVPDYPAEPGHSYPAQPDQAYPGQPNQGFPGQPGQAYPAQPNQPYPGQPYPAQPNQGFPGYTPQVDPRAADKSGGQLVWLIGLVSLFGFIWLSPLFSIIAVLIVWSVVRRRGPLSAGNARNAMNWAGTYLLAHTLFFVLHILMLSMFSGSRFFSPPLITTVLLLGLAVANLVALILGSIRSSRGEVYRFPLAIPFHLLTRKID